MGCTAASAAERTVTAGSADWARLLLAYGRGAAGLAAKHLRSGPARRVAVTIGAASLAGMGILSLRQVRLYAIGRRAGSLIASLGFAAPGLATLAFLGAQPLSVGWCWPISPMALACCFAAGGLLLAHHRDRSIAIVLSPVLTRGPLAALQLGLTPVVHQFVAALQIKDEVTRRHVIRGSELAMRAGERSKP